MFIKLLLSILIIILIFYFILVPIPIKFFINLFDIKPQHYDILKSDPATVEIINDEKNAYTFYKTTAAENNENLIIWFNGGAFLYSDRSVCFGFLNNLYLKLDKKFNILIFNYPVRFKNSIYDAMLHINNLFNEKLKLQEKFKNFYGIGMSAGALLMATFQQKETKLEISKKIQIPQIGLKFKSLVSICGVLSSTNFNNKFLNQLFKFYIMSKTPNYQEYSMYNLSPDTPKLLISWEKDFLYSQTISFLQTESNCQSLIFSAKKNPYLNHQFIEFLNFPETEETVKKVANFLIS